MSRRQFLIASTLAGAGVALTSRWRPPAAASDRVRIGIVGVSRRGMRHIAGYSSVHGAEVVALYDSNAQRLRAGEKMVADAGAGRAVGYTDWRRMLEREDIDAVSVATADSDQTAMALAACVAGKDLLLDGPRRSLSDLCRLRDAAREGGRLAGQVYHAQFAGTADARAEISSDTLDKLNVARARREFVAAGQPDDGCGVAGAQGCESLLFSPVEEFDYVRAVLDVQSPRTVSCVTVRGARRGEVVRAAMRYEFETAAGLKTVELEAVAAPDIEPALAGPDHDAPRGAGIIRFAGGGSAFTVRSGHGGDFARDGTPGAWHNFVDCVRSRRAADLIAPLSEFTASLEMLRLASLSVESGQPVLFR